MNLDKDGRELSASIACDAYIAITKALGITDCSLDEISREVDMCMYAFEGALTSLIESVEREYVAAEGEVIACYGRTVAGTYMVGVKWNDGVEFPACWACVDDLPIGTRVVVPHNAAEQGMVYRATE